MDTTWLKTFADAAPARITTDPQQRLSRRALAARTSPAERDALFADLSATLARWVWPYRGWLLAPWEFDDVVQESYLAFIDTLDLWCQRVRQGPNGRLEPDFLRYLLRTYPLRLIDRVQALVDSADAQRMDPYSLDAEIPDPWTADADVRARMLIDAICARLHPRDALTFRLVVSSGYALRALARRTGENPRTIYHRWARIIATAREVLTSRDAA